MESISPSATRKNTIYPNLKEALLIAAGVILAGFGINGFLLSSHFIDGGVTGISMLLTDITGYPIAILLAVINIPFIIVGYKRIGLSFAVKTSMGILALALCLAFFPYPDVTSDKLLTAVFGGFFIGTGIGLAIRGGAVLDGVEIAAVLLSKGSRLLKVSDVILLLNVAIFAAAALFLGVERALYSILTYFAASKMIDYVVNGIEEYTGVTIISKYNNEIRELIVNKFHHGVTTYNSSSGFGKRGENSSDNKILYTVITRIEAGTLQNEIERIDPEAVVISQSVNSIKGGIIKQRPLH